MITKNLILFLKRFFLVFIFYQITRLGFYVYNFSYLDDWNLAMFWGGIRFDLAALGYINIVFALLHLIPGKFQTNKSYQTILFYGFYLVNITILCLNFVDYEYFKFIGRRSTFSFITASGMENEALGLLQSFIVQFWWIPVFIASTYFLFWFFYRRIPYKIQVNNFSYKALGVALLVTSSLLVLGRGGFQKKPLKLVDASQYGGMKNTSLVLNTPFSILKTIGKNDKIKQLSFYSETELDSIFNPVVSFHYDSINKRNVVLLIIESLGRETMFKGQTPFMDSLVQNSYFFENAFANGKLSIDAVPSTISSLPSLMDMTYISSPYALNDIYALPKILEKQGYHTAFFHGAFNGSQNFDQFANVVGFKEYYGKNEYVGPNAFDGTWGIFDEEFLQFFAEKLDHFEKPFFATLFTISSHNPYTIPNRYKGKFPKGETEIDESIAYADFALKQFFEKAKIMPWYDNTIFVLTADHTSSPFREEKWANNVGKFRIPILFLAPGDASLQPQKIEKNFQQIDILPSLLDYLQITDTVVTYGKSFKSAQDFAISYLDHIYNYKEGDFYLAFDGEKVLGLYNWKEDPELKVNLQNERKDKVTEMVSFLKAYMQSFNERVANNKTVIK